MTGRPPVPDGGDGSVDAVKAAVRGCCPRCGNGPLFRGLVAFAPRCTSCGLDFEAFNVGDGPAAFLTLAIGIVVVGLAMFVELSYAPPLWVHILLWAPLIAVSTLASLRVCKAALLALEYRNHAAEGRLDERPR